MAITRDMYLRMLNAENMGRARKQDSDIIKDATFTNDIQYQIGYFCDYYHTLPENRLKIDGIDPSKDPNLVPVELKFIAHSQKTYEKDEVTMHIEFRPNHVCQVDYYDTVFGSRYNAEYPVGLYVWLNENGVKYHRWLVVATADAHEHMAPLYEVLRCTDVYRWVKNGKLYEIPGVARSQNSYNGNTVAFYRNIKMKIGQYR